MAGGMLFRGGPDRYLRLRYEDFVADPPATVRRILAMVGMEDAPLPFVGPQRGSHHDQPQCRRQPRSASPRADHAAAGRSLAQRDGAAGPPAGQRAHVAPAAPLRVSAASRASRRPAAARPSSIAPRRRGRGRASSAPRAAPPPLGPHRGVRTARRGGRAQPGDSGSCRGRQVAVAPLPPASRRARHPGLSGRPAALGDEHARPGSRRRSRVRGAQRERPGRLRPLPPARRRCGPPRRHGEPARIRALQAALRLPPCRPSARHARHAVAGPCDLGISRCGRPRAIGGVEVRAEQPAHAPRHRGREGRGHVAGTAAVARRHWTRCRASTIRRCRQKLPRRSSGGSATASSSRSGLDRRDDVLLASYQDMLASPAPAMQAICRFLRLEYRPALIEHIAPRGPGGARPLDIDPRVRVLCDQLQSRLDEALRRQRDGRAA